MESNIDTSDIYNEMNLREAKILREFIQNILKSEMYATAYDKFFAMGFWAILCMACSWTFIGVPINIFAYNHYYSTGALVGSGISVIIPFIIFCSTFSDYRVSEERVKKGKKLIEDINERIIRLESLIE